MMTGKSKLPSFKYLLLISLLVIVISTIYFQNIYIFILYCISLTLSFLSVKFGIKKIQSKNLLQNIRDEGPLAHQKKEIHQLWVG